MSLRIGSSHTMLSYRMGGLASNITTIGGYVLSRTAGAVPVAVCIACAAFLAASAHAEQLRAGAAKVRLKLPARIALAGYRHRHGKPSLGEHDPLFARAVVLSGSNIEVAIVSCDILIIDERLEDEVRRSLSRIARLRNVRLLLSASHTHSGPGAYGHKFLEQLSMGHFDMRVRRALSGAITQAIEIASSSLYPVKVRYAAADKKELVRNRMSSATGLDAELNVLSLEGATSSPLAIIVSFGAHPTTLGAWNMFLSGDYPGVLARDIESRYPGVVCLFMASDVGDQAPVKAGIGFERAEWFGRALAVEAASLAQSALEVGTASGIEFARSVVRLPPARLRLGGISLPAKLSRSFVDDDATLSLVRIGSVVIMGMPCDVSSELGIRLRRYARSVGAHPIVVGFANDYIGYCLPERLYDSGEYEAFMMFNGPRTGDLLVDKLKRLLARSIGRT